MDNTIEKLWALRFKYEDDEHVVCSDAATELSHLRAEIADGTLTRLPYRIGDRVYFIKRDYKYGKVTKTYIVHGNVKSIKFDRYGVHITVEYFKAGIGGCGKTIAWYTGYKDTQVFLTEPEAEAALAAPEVEK